MYRVLTSEDVALGVPGDTVATCVSFNHTGSILTFLYPDETNRRQLYYINVALAKESGTVVEMRQLIDFTVGGGEDTPLSLAEELRRERMRCFTAGLAWYEVFL